MKKITLSIVALVLLGTAACRKDRTCECTTTTTTNGSGESQTTTQVVGHATKTEAKRLTNCYSYTQSETRTIAGTVYSIQTVSECELK